MTFIVRAIIFCLDFVNTVDGRESDSPRRKSQSVNTLVLGNKLEHYSDLVEWSLHSGILTATEARKLIQEGKRSATDAQAVLERALIKGSTPPYLQSYDARTPAAGP